MVTQVVKIFPTHYGTQRFITLFQEHATGLCPEPYELSDEQTQGLCMHLN